MKRILIALLVCCIANFTEAKSTNQLINEVTQKFTSIKNFKSDIDIHFNIPSINISEMKGKVFYASPNKFKIKLSGVAFLPKQNPFELFNLLKDSSTYLAVMVGNEKIRNINCSVISILPKSDQDIVMEKLWINADNKTIMKSEITTKSNGTLKADYFYESMNNTALPDKILFSIDLNKFKLPKMIAVDLNSTKKNNSSSTKKDVGTIEFNFLNYIINKGVDAKDLKD